MKISAFERAFEKDLFSLAKRVQGMALVFRTWCVKSSNTKILTTCFFATVLKIQSYLLTRILTVGLKITYGLL